MLNAIVAALTALPELITLGKQLYGFYMTMTGQTVKEKVQNTSKALSFLADIDPEKIQLGLPRTAESVTTDFGRSQGLDLGNASHLPQPQDTNELISK